ncbi:hypothetical protein F5144DRAFT_621182 [Chaetomium tenue]|uniref:Uncharacterized protein n=1 Tax=Chaetomium tenue TaxID=1854479 RepID=A0ACB7P7T3_9PEZI|nr:hypothetical protein F5144DRAFT_621182 [Chaetomium globosum]
MANRELLFFYAPAWDFPPDGPIKLGNIITSVKTPHRPLSCSPPPDDSYLFQTEKRSVRYTQEELRSGKFSILTKFLSILGFGIDISAEMNHNTATTFTFTTLTTTHFTPTPSHLTTILHPPQIQRYLTLSRHRKPLYPITGLKTVHGAQAHTLASRSVGGAVAVEVDGTVWSGGAVPVGGGPGVEGGVGGRREAGWEGSSDFVFAFSVCRLVVGLEEYRKGAMLKGRMVGVDVVAVEGVVDAEGEGFDGEELREGEEVVFCVIPRGGREADEW